MDGGLWERVSTASANSVAECGGAHDTVCSTCKCYCSHMTDHVRVTKYDGKQSRLMFGLIT